MAAVVGTAAVLSCSARTPDCVLQAVYKHHDVGMFAPRYYCYACLPNELRDRQHQLVYLPARRGVDRPLEGLPEAEFALELPPPVVAGTTSRAIGPLRRTPRQKPPTPDRPASRVPHDARPVVIPEPAFTRPDKRVPEPARPTPRKAARRRRSS